jgi:hypothetical protein
MSQPPPTGRPRVEEPARARRANATSQLTRKASPTHTATAMEKLRIVTVGRSSADFPRHDCSPYRGLHVRRESVGLVQGPFSVAPCRTRTLRFATFSPLYTARCVLRNVSPCLGSRVCQVLTTDDRDKWAATRASMMQDPGNKVALTKLDKGIIAVCLDEAMPSTQALSQVRLSPSSHPTAPHCL